MTRNKKLDDLSEFLYSIDENKIIRLDTNVQEEIEVIKLMVEHKLDFDDALQLFLCKKHKLKLISFDQDFDKIDIERLEPSEIL